MKRISLFLCLLLAVSAVAGNDPAEVVWRTPLKEVGQSGVCVHGDQLFLTVHTPIEGEGKNFRKSDIIGQCFDKNTGQLLWEVPLPGVEEYLVLDSWRSDTTTITPLADDKRVVFHNLAGLLLGCDTNGEVLWERPFQPPPKKVPNHGGRLYLHDGLLIVALPDEDAGGHRYRLHGIDPATGEDRWVSEAPQHHASHYSLQPWRGEMVVASSITNLSHYKFGKPFGFLISPRTGEILEKFDLPNASGAHKHQLHQDAFLVPVRFPSKKENKEKTSYRFVDPRTGETTWDLTFAYPETWYTWTGEAHEIRPYEEKFIHRYLTNRKVPTYGTVHLFDGRIFYLSLVSPSIGCIDIETKKVAMIDIPMQAYNGKVGWDDEEVDYLNGAIHNAAGKVVSTRGKRELRGPHWAGFGHLCPPHPVRTDDFVYWQGGIGILYRIDLTGEFTPDKISWTAIDDTQRLWTWGSPGVDSDGVYVRSQLALTRLKW
ncbi:MAG: PQQ-binding-like beta-propeller repeat protein [Verrucomicrobiota bacterium]